MERVVDLASRTAAESEGVEGVLQRLELPVASEATATWDASAARFGAASGGRAQPVAFEGQLRKQGGSLQALVNVNAKAQFESNYWRGVLDAQGKVDGGYY